MTRVLQTLSFVFLASCAAALPNEDGAIVDKLRLLAARAEPPEISPGQTAALDALVIDPKGGGRSLTYTWLACDPDLNNFYGTVCSNGDRLRDLAALARDPSVHSLGTAPTASYAASSQIFAGRASDDPLRFFGVSAEILLVVSPGTFEQAAAGTVESQTAFLRVAVSELPSAIQNANPTFIDATATGSPLLLTMTAPPSAAQTFFELDPTVPEGYRERPEGLFVRWYATAGVFTARPDLDDGTPPVKGRAMNIDAPTGTTVAVVLRDGRGGVAWKRVVAK